jgi:hypothetical protein
MRKAIYLNVLTHVQTIANRPIDSQAALGEIDRLVRTLDHHKEASLSLDVKRVRLENEVDSNGVDVGILIYLEAEQDAASNFANFATSELETKLKNTFKQPTLSNLAVTVRKIEENTNAVDELADENERFKG